MDEQQRQKALSDKSYYQSMADELKRDIDADNLRILEEQYSEKIKEFEKKERIVQAIIDLYEENKHMHEQNRHIQIKYAIWIVSVAISLCVIYSSK